MMLLGGRWALSNVAGALAWAYHTLMDSPMMLRMKLVPTVWGQECSTCDRCMEEVGKAAAHCSSKAGSHSSWRTDLARSATL